jgi:hypothetical protein
MGGRESTFAESDGKLNTQPLVKSSCGSTKISAGKCIFSMLTPISARKLPEERRGKSFIHNGQVKEEAHAGFTGAGITNADQLSDVVHQL